MNKDQTLNSTFLSSEIAVIMEEDYDLFQLLNSVVKPGAVSYGKSYN